MFLMHERAETGDVGGRIRSSERRPQPVIEVACGEFAVINERNERESVDTRSRIEVPQELPDRAFLLAVTRTESCVERRRGDDQNSGNRDTRIVKPVGQRQLSRNRCRQLAARRASGGNDELGAGVKTVPRVVERVDRRLRLEMQIGAPIGSLQDVTEERLDVVDVELRIVLASNDEKVLGQRELTLAKNRVRAGQQLLRLALGRVRDVSLAADCKQQRMYSGGIDGVDRFDSGDDRGNDRAGDLVDDLAKARVFLRRSADHRERPNRAVAMKYLLDTQHGKVVREAVVTQMITERAFWFETVRIDGAHDAKVGFGGDR